MSDRRVVILGAGLGGLAAAIKLQEAGYRNFTLLDRNPAVGGTWHENTYPGCACDVPVALYQFSFAQSLNWTRLFPQSPEIQAYAEEITDRYQLRPHLRLSEAATSAVWSDDTQSWTVTSELGNTYEADILVGALGQLNRPGWPDIPGRDSFEGVSMHSARWDHAHNWEGKRVGVIGSAASAVQIIPEMAKTADHLTVFQRSPNWVVPRNDREVPPEEQALMFTEPDLAMKLAAQNREMIWENADYFFWQAFQWTEAGRAAYTRQATDHLNAQISNPDLRAKLTPDYPVGCRRILISDDFYPALERDNVSLVTDGIGQIEGRGVRTADDTLHEIDFLVYATGFETTGWNWSVDVKGRSGQSLNEAWADVPEAYLGITVTDFPNLFVLYGPNTNLGHNSITWMIERQVEYMIEALKGLDRADAKALMPTKAAQERYNAQLQKDLVNTVWADPACNSWYKTADGRITQNWSSHTRGYADAVKTVRIEDYELS